MTILGFLLWFSLTFGYQDGLAVMTRSAISLDYYPAPLYAGIEIHAESSWLDLYGAVETDMHRADGVWWQFWPVLDTYTVGAKLKLGHVVVKAEHQCSHPLLVFNWTPKTSFDTGITKVEVIIRSKP